MTRMSKQGERRHTSPRRPRTPQAKTGSLKDNLPKGFKEHKNAAQSANVQVFIPEIR